MGGRFYIHALDYQWVEMLGKRETPTLHFLLVIDQAQYHRQKGCVDAYGSTTNVLTMPAAWWPGEPQ
jgi:hypothetical protein